MGSIITDIITEHDAKFVDGGQNVKDILELIKQPSVTDKFFPLTPTKKTVIEKATVTMSTVLQAFQVNYTPIGNATFKPVSIPMYRMKVDSSITPDELQASWLGFLAEKGLNKKEMPITKFYQRHLIEQSKEDFENNEVYGGVYVDPTVDEANSPGENMNGIKKQINDAISAGTAQVVTLGAVPAEPVDFVNYVEEFIDSIPELMRNYMDIIFMSQDLKKRFMVGMRAKYNQYYAAEDLLSVFGTRIVVEGLPSMAGSTKIFTTPKANRASYRKNGEQQNGFDVQANRRVLEFMNDWWVGVGFWIMQYLYTNDVETP